MLGVGWAFVACAINMKPEPKAVAALLPMFIV